METDFNTFVDFLRRDWQVDACMTAYSHFLGLRLAFRMMAECRPYVPAPGAREAVLHSEYSTGSLRHGSEFAVACGGGR
jgi:hypothetical protein